ncbi:hypothetical protein [uncultured Thiodictyon sp.]|uniref:nSTAND1 domain-containing NTPase n=1 Tax=uncultured Thiodictyon sp. TaxID=1846217 RepID=UPI0025CF41E2|nr:hypothetical protein [uncultured Thiodictyon sp.]
MPPTAEPASRRPPPHPFRIFLASPGDVAHERQIVREVIDQVRMELRFCDRLDLKLIAWDQPGAAVAMQAGLTPQEAIDRGLPRPCECDLVLALFWGRMGTPLASDYRRPDGSPYASGSEWEYRNALEGFRAHGRPAVWLFRRTQRPTVQLGDPALQELEEQWQAVERFVAAERNNPDGSIASGINRYQTPEAFATLLERLLRDHLERLVSTLDQAPASADGAADADAPVTAEPAYRGDPYPGLAAFTPEQAPIFFGRDAPVDQLSALLKDPRTRFAVVVGLSGAGKSSLVAAGLIPRLREGLIGGAPWVDCRFTPAERGRDPFLSLAWALKGYLPGEGGTVADLARDLQTDPGRFGAAAATLLAGRPAGAELLLYIDQLEELFVQTDPVLTADFVALLSRAADLPRVRCLATLRADFYAAACAEAGLAALLRRDRGTLPLDPPGRPALAAMIARPARAVGLELEEGLTDRILEDARGSAAGPGTLALTAFALNELYRLGGAAGRLTQADYTAIGGIDGAVRLCAEKWLGDLGQVPDAALGDLFEHLVEVDEQEIATRRRAPQADLPPASRPLADALTRARLLTAGRGADEAPTLELAHESLLRAWPRLADWVRDHAEALRARRDLERAAAEWQAARRPATDLRVGPQLKRYRGAPPPRSQLAADYLRACGRRVRRGRVLGTLGLVLLGGIVLVWNHINQPTGYPPSLMAKGLAVQLGLGRLPGPLRLLHEPEVVAIPGGGLPDGRRYRRWL